MRQITKIMLAITVCGASAWSAETRYFGGIDLGSKGTKAALFSFIQEADGTDERVVYGRTINTKLVSSMKDGNFTDEGIQDATDAVKQLVDEMKAEAGKKSLANVEYFVVGSSGVAKAANKESLVASVKKATGIDMDFIDAKREGYYGLLSSVPPRRRNASMYVDIGSGNTKLGCLVGGADLGSFRTAEIPYGSVTGRKKASEKSPTDITMGIQKVMNEDVKPAYDKESMDTPCLRNRQRLYWTGGAAWATATFTHPERASRPYVVITKKDLDAFLAKLTDGSWSQKNLEFNFASDVPPARQKEIREKAEKDKGDVMNTFVREDLLSGVSIMKTVLESSNPSALLQFVRGGNFLYGYAMEKFKEDRDGDDSPSGR